MEKLRARAWFLSLALIAFGLFVQLSPRASAGPERSESWLESIAPRSVGAFRMVPGRNDPNQTYRMDRSAYEELNPFGIVVRVYQSGDKAFDVALIASNRKESFHDQRVCFSAQGWTMTGDKAVRIETKTLGSVPASVLSLASASKGSQLAVVLYKGPGGHHRNPRGLTWAMFLEQLRGGKNLESVFYRIMPLHRGVTESELLKFAGEYLDAANESSHGYF